AAGELRIEDVEVDEGTARFDVSLRVTEAADGRLAITWEYATDLFDRTTVQRLSAQFLTLLSGLEAAGDPPLSRLPLLSAAEGHQLLAEWNDSASGEELEPTLYGLFTAQVERTPDTVAVACGNEAVSYLELARRASAVAARLAGLGMGPEGLVGVY